MRSPGLNGAPCLPETAQAIEKRAARLERQRAKLARHPRGTPRIFDPRPDYVRQLEKLVDFNLLRRHRKRAVVDLMFVAKQINATTWLSAQVFGTALIIYYLMARVALIPFLRWLEVLAARKVGRA